MMTIFKAISISLCFLILASLTVGCSTSPDSPVELPQTSLQDEYIAGISSAHFIFGVWSVGFDTSTNEIYPIAMRNIAAHFNITDFLTPPQCDDCLILEVIDYKPLLNVIKLKVSLKNNTPLTAYDVRAIMMVNIEGIILLNADGYTDLWDDGGEITVNPFKAYATDQPGRMFGPNTAHARIYEINYTSIADLVSAQIVVDASWPGNCREPYAIDGFQQNGTIVTAGGTCGVNLNIYDWQDDAEDVFVDASPIGGGLVELSYVEGFTWAGNISTVQYNLAGAYNLQLYAGSENTSQKLYEYGDVEIIPCEAEGNETWENATPLDIGTDTGSQVVCIYDKEDWYKFTVTDYIYGEIRLSVTSDNGPCDLRFYSDPEGEYLAAGSGEFGSDFMIDLSAPDLGEGEYYLRVRHLGDNLDAKEYIVYLNVKDSPCYPDDNNSYLDSIELDENSNTEIEYVCSDDEADWFSITCDGDEDGFIRLTISNETGPAEITLYDETQAPNPEGAFIDQSIAEPSATIDLEPHDLNGVYYVRVQYSGTDENFRTYWLEHVTSQAGWVRTWGEQATTLNEYVHSVNCDYAGNIFTLGKFHGSVDFDPGPGVNELVSINDSSTFLCKFDGYGNHIWAGTFGNSQYSDSIYGFAVDSSANVYVSGLFKYTIDFDIGPGVYEVTHEGWQPNMYIAKYSPDGNIIFVRIFPPSVAYGTISLDTADNIYLTGGFYETIDFDPGPGVEEHTAVGGTDIFLMKLNSSGDMLWTRTWGGILNESGTIVTPYGTSAVYATGGFNDTIDFDPGDGVSEYGVVGDSDIYLCKYDVDGNFQWVRAWGGFNEEVSFDMVCNSAGDVLIGGYFESNLIDFDPGTPVDLRYGAGSRDCFISCFDPNGDYLWALNWGDEHSELIRVLVMDDLNNLYACGLTNSDAIDLDPGPGDHIVDTNGKSTPFVIKFNSDIETLWVRSWGSKDYFYAYDIDNYGTYSIAIGGSFSQTIDFEPGPGVTEKTADGDREIYLTKLLSDGNW